MKLYLPFILVILFFLFACSGSRKTTVNPDNNNVVEVSSKTEIISEKSTEEPIVEVEEKLVTLNNIAPDPYNYFVIIGSFRNPNNARNFQKQIEKDGFSSDLLKNEAGLYRVSVMASNDILAARKEIKRIREKYPKYLDTWLLVQVK
jgi:cell division protein FtsN